MKAFAAALTCALATASVALGANPLTVAEQQVCRSLSHCLNIIDRHSQDSFDYSVLSREFERFGARGEKALLKMLRRDGKSAGHAADLLALTGTTETVGALRDYGSSQTVLMRRTVMAIETRLQAQARSTRPVIRVNGGSKAPDCEVGQSVGLDHRRREMPFFEADMATPDRYGTFRPSANHDSPVAFSSRAYLVSARPVPGGWLAAYPDGLLHYDNASGAPALRLRGWITSLQPRSTGTLSEDGWIFLQTKDGRTQILSQNPSANGADLRQISTLPRPLAHLRRTSDGALIAIDEGDDAVVLRPDATATAGCPSKHD